MKFELAQCNIRIALPTDADDLVRMSKTIWEGHDYLPMILSRWIGEDWFFVVEYQSRIIACLKLSLFPDNVIWFEGLRVHGKYQGLGIGTMLNAYAFGFAEQLRKQNPAISYEFCTYYKNYESLKMTKKAGFRIVEHFYQLDKRGVRDTKEPEIVTDYDMSIFKAYKKYIPLGWQAVRNHPDSLYFIKQRATVFLTPQSIYLLAGLADKNVIFLQTPVKDFKSELPYLQHFFGSRKKYGVILPMSMSRDIPFMQSKGFYFWEGEKEPVRNMVIKRK